MLTKQKPEFYGIFTDYFHTADNICIGGSTEEDACEADGGSEEQGDNELITPVCCAAKANTENEDDEQEVAEQTQTLDVEEESNPQNSPLGELVLVR